SDTRSNTCGRPRLDRRGAGGKLLKTLDRDAFGSSGISRLVDDRTLHRLLDEGVSLVVAVTLRIERVVILRDVVIAVSDACREVSCHELILSRIRVLPAEELHPTLDRRWHVPRLGLQPASSTSTRRPLR